MKPLLTYAECGRHLILAAGRNNGGAAFSEAIMARRAILEGWALEAGAWQGRRKRCGLRLCYEEKIAHGDGQSAIAMRRVGF
jgi:hypothetical protein